MRLMQTVLLSMLLLSIDEQTRVALGRRTRIESMHKEQLSKGKNVYLIRPQHMHKTRVSSLRSNNRMPKRVRYKKIIEATSETDITQEPEPFELEDGWITGASAARKAAVAARKAIEGRAIEMSDDSETDTTQEPEPFELEEMTTQEPEPFEQELFESSTSSRTEKVYSHETSTSILVPSEDNSDPYRTISAAPTMHSAEVSESKNQASKKRDEKEKTIAIAKSSLATDQATTEQTIFYNVSDEISAGYAETSRVESSDLEKMQKAQKIEGLKNVARSIIPTKALVEKTWKLETRASTESKTVQTKSIRVARSRVTPSTGKFPSKSMSLKERQTRKEQAKNFLPLFTTHLKARTKKTNETRILISALINEQAKRRAFSRTNIARQMNTFRVTDDKSLQRKQERKEEIEERAVSASTESAETIGKETPETVISKKMKIVASNTKEPSQNSISRLMRSTEVLSSNESQGNIAFINIFLLPNLLETTNISEPVLAKMNTAIHVKPTTVVTTETVHEKTDKGELVAPMDATQDSKDVAKATSQSLPEGTEDGKVNHMDAEPATTIVVTKEPLEATKKRDIVASTKADAPTESVHKPNEFTEDMVRSVETLKIIDTIEAMQQFEPVGSSTTLAIITTAYEGAATVANEQELSDPKSGTPEPTNVESSSSLATEELPTLSKHRTLSGDDEAALAASTENNIDSPSTTISGNTEETASTEQNTSISEIVAIESSRVWTNETDHIGSNSSAEEALVPEKQQRTEPPSTLNVHLHHYNNVISVELLLVTALILVCALFALLLIVFLAIRNERKFQRKKAGYISEALHEVDRNSNVIKTKSDHEDAVSKQMFQNDCNVEAPPPITKPSKLSKTLSKKKTKSRKLRSTSSIKLLQLQSKNTLNETRSTLDERSYESDVYFEIVPKPPNNFGKKRRRPRESCKSISLL